MRVQALQVPGSWSFTPQQFDDSRGSFAEWYRYEEVERVVGHPLDLRQANISRSKKGVIRGVHFVDLPGQAKYVTCAHGAVLDYVVDLRVGSPTFGKWDSVLLDSHDRRAIYIAEGLGHAYVALEEDSIVTYLCSNVYNFDTEGSIYPLDPDIALTFPPDLGDPILSQKDIDAPRLQDLIDSGKLPTWDIAREFSAATATDSSKSSKQ